MTRTAILTSLQRLCLVVWVGGGLFFASVLAPQAFHVLHDQHAAGLLVGASLRALHWIGLACGTLFILAALFFRTFRGLAAWKLGSAATMVALTAYSQWSILPAMEMVRSAGPTTQAFAALHRRSVWIEATVLLLGLMLTVLPDPGALEASRRR